MRATGILKNRKHIRWPYGVILNSRRDLPKSCDIAKVEYISGLDIKWDLDDHTHWHLFKGVHEFRKINASYEMQYHALQYSIVIEKTYIIVCFYYKYMTTDI